MLPAVKLILLFCSLYAATEAMTNTTEQPNVLIRWMGFILSRSGIYVTLVSIIIINVLISTIKTKFEKFATEDNGLCLVRKNKLTPWSTDLCGRGSSSSEEDTDYIKERLREAEVTVAALKTELEQTLKTKLTLENSLEELERDKSYSEDELMKTKMAGAMELENLKKENAALQRQWERAKMDIENLTTQIDVLQREARISEATLRDHQNVAERLNIAATELENVKTQLKGIKIERNTAVRIASEQIYKTMAGESNQRRELIEEMIDIELKRMREEEEASERVQETQNQLISQSEDYVGNNDTQNGIDPRELMTYETNTGRSNHRNALGDAPPIVCNCPDDTYNLTTEASISSNLDRPSTSEDCSDEELERPRMLTDSPAFRAFLQDTFGR